LSYAQLYGSDKFTDNLIRHNRNLHFKSDVWGGDLDLRFHIKNPVQGRTSRWLIHPKYYRIWMKCRVSLIGGIGYIDYTSKTKLKDELITLNSLNTEVKKHEAANIKNDLTYSFGLGITYTSRRRNEFGIEIINKYTSTDYLDDVSGSYYDNDLLRQEYGDLTANLADRRIEKTIGGTERGNSAYNDSYFFVNFVFQFVIPRHKIKNWFTPKEEELVE